MTRSVSIGRNSLSDGFHTLCTTCTSRLLVKDAALIGEILGCPKCGSMVLIEAPDGYEPAVGDDVASTEVDAEAEVPHSEKLTSELAKPAAPNYLSMAFVGLGAMALVASVGGYWWHYRTEYPSAARIEAGREQQVTDTASLVDTGTLEGKSTPATNDDVSEAPSLEAPSLEATSLEATSLEATSLEAPSLEAPSPEGTPSVEGSASLQASTSLDSTPSQSPVIIAEEIDPFEETDERLPVATASSQPPAMIDAPALNTDDSLHELVHLLGGEAESLGQGGSGEATESESFRPSRHHEPIDTSVLENLTLSNARFSNVSLIDFVRSFEQISNVPIVIDPRALDVTGNTLGSTVSCEDSDVSLETLIGSAIEPLGLHMEVRDYSVVITSKRLTDGTIMNYRLPVDDLVSDDFPIDQFVATLVSPRRWRRNGGAGTLKVQDGVLIVENTRPTIVQVTIFLERLRKARRLPGKQRVPSHLVPDRPAWERLHSLLSTSVDLNHWDTSSLAQVLASLESELGVNLLVDWQELASYGVTPANEVAAYVRGKTLQGVVAGLMEQLDVPEDGWAFQAVDGTTMELTSRRKMMESESIAFYDYERFETGQKRLFEQAMLRGNAAIDPASGVAIVRANSELHRALAR